MIDFRRSPILAISAAVLVFQMPASAQDDNLNTMVTNSLTAMNAGKWEEADALLGRAIERYGSNQPAILFGPRFGLIYYRKGICEFQLRKYPEAMKSFETCFNDFPNDGDAKAGGGNIYRTRALLRWGEAAMGAEEWETALGKFNQFLKIREKEDTFSVGELMLNMATCNYHLTNFEAGHKLLDDAIAGRRNYGIPDDGIFSVFMTFAELAVAANDQESLVSFIDARRPRLILAPYLGQRFTERLLKLSADALNSGMDRGPFALQQLIVSTQAAIEDLEDQIASLGNRAGLREGMVTLNKSRLEAELAALKQRVSEGRTSEAYRLITAAVVHERSGNVRGAFVAYQDLEGFSKRSPQRESNLFNLVRTGSLLGEALITARNAQLFLTDFPDSEYVPSVKRMMLASLFYDGRYDECIAIATELIGSLEKGTPEHEICLHVLGGSKYYTNANEDAIPFLNEYVQLYPEGTYIIAATYFQAANQSRLNQWELAGTLLDAFLKKYPDPDKNAYLPFALYDRATCHFAKEENEQALEVLKPVFRDFSNSAIVDAAYNLQGNLLQTEGEIDAAEESYAQALEIASRRYSRQIASEALSNLVGLLGDAELAKEDPERFSRAVEYADQFWKEYGGDSPYEAQVAVSQVPPLVSVGRAEEALGKIQGLIRRAFEADNAFGVEALLNTYTELYLDQHSPEDLKEHYYNFEGVSINNKAARAILRVALIGVFERISKESETEAEKRAAAASVQVLFNELKRDFAPTDLTPFILVRVADFIRSGTGSPSEATPYYEQVLATGDTTYRFDALLGIGETLALAGGKANYAKAAENFERVFNESENRSQRDSALYNLARMQYEGGDYKKAIATALSYTSEENSQFNAYTAQVMLLLARSQAADGQIAKALGSYNQVTSNHTGFIEISAPAVLEWMEILWKRNQGGDRQSAYDGGDAYINQVSRLKTRMSKEDLQAVEKVENLTNRYGSNANIRRTKTTPN